MIFILEQFSNFHPLFRISTFGIISNNINVGFKPEVPLRPSPLIRWCRTSIYYIVADAENHLVDAIMILNSHLDGDFT